MTDACSNLDNGTWLRFPSIATNAVAWDGPPPVAAARPRMRLGRPLTAPRPRMPDYVAPEPPRPLERLQARRRTA